MTPRSILIRGGRLVTMDAARRVIDADLLVEGATIAAIAPVIAPPPDVEVLDAGGLTVLPGLIQGHVHMGQALFRGLAERRALLPWLRERVWPLEAAHDQDSVRASTLLGAAECLLSGTTTVADIGVVHGWEALLSTLEDSGLRAVAGPCLMDADDGSPPALRRTTADSLAVLERAHASHHGAADDRIHVTACPRFILSCTRQLWQGCAERAGELGIAVHTHLLEHRDEEAEVARRLGAGQMEFLDRTGILDTRLRVAHGVWLGDRELAVLGGRSLGVVHCPSANLKLGSGIADLAGLRRAPNLVLGIGSDGSACNNDMDVLEELRLAALLAAQRSGAEAPDAEAILGLATLEGARLLGLEDRIGSLEPGKRADLTLLDLERPATFAHASVPLYDRIVWTAARDAVRHVMVDGRLLVRSGELVALDRERILADAARELDALVERAGLA